MRAALEILFLCLVVSVITSLAMSRFALAFRPFVSTDASVVERGELEIELGLFEFSRDDGIDEITVSNLVLNYGILRNWEVVGEFGVQVFKEGEERNGELLDPALFLKGVLREGVLQGHEGPSIAVEFGVLLPSTVDGERKAGFEGIGIVSAKALDFLYHLNVGGELDREDSDPNILWGVILEYPVRSIFRLVGEVNGNVIPRESSESSGLIGFIWEIGGVGLDFGFRKGFSDAAPDWEFTTGATFSF